MEVGLPISLGNFNNEELLLVSLLDKCKYQDVDEGKFNEYEYNVSVSVASAITSYSRIYMSQFKNRLDYNLYYSDTDSIYIDRKLPDEYIGNNLGQFKLENIFKDCILLAPKVYGGLTTDEKLILKIKGLTKVVINNEISPCGIDKLLLLLHKDKTLVLNQVKSYKDFTKGSINLLEQTYSLVATENNRSLIWKDSIFVDTKPYIIDNSVLPQARGQI